MCDDQNREREEAFYACTGYNKCNVNCGYAGEPKRQSPDQEGA